MDNNELAELFKSQGYEWNFSTGRRIPNAEEIGMTVETLKEALAEADDNTQAEAGRFIVKKKGSAYDVYVHVAEFE